MNAFRILVAVAVLAAPSAASAQPIGANQQVKLLLRNGRVTLDARNASVVQILREWARVGGVTIVNGDKVAGPPVTLQLTNVPERQALDLLLRGASGYMLGVRGPGTRGSSAYDRILILATGSAPRPAAPSSAAAQPPVRTPPPQADNDPDDLPDPPVALGGMRRFTPPIIRPPTTAAVPADTPPQGAGTPASKEAPATTPDNPDNPFGMPVGSGLPGAVTPAPAPPTQQAPARR